MSGRSIDRSSVAVVPKRGVGRSETQQTVRPHPIDCPINLVPVVLVQLSKALLVAGVCSINQTPA